MPQSFSARAEPGSVLELAADFVWRCGRDFRLDRLELIDADCPRLVVAALRGARLDRLEQRVMYPNQAAELAACLHSGARIANLCLTLPAGDGPPLHVALRGAPLADATGRGAGYHGTGQVWGAKPFDAQQRGELAHLLEKAEAARDRERGLRRETEALLASLQALLEPTSLIDKCRRMFALYRDLLEFESALVVRRGIGGRLRVLVATEPALDGETWPEGEALATVLAGGPARLADLAAAALPAALAGRRFGALLVPLLIGKETAVLIALHRRVEAFGERHLNLARRLSLLAAEALRQEEQKAQIANASKLAAMGEMLTTIAHELSQPLSVVSMAAQNGLSMTTSGASGAEISAKFERIHDQAKRAGEIIRAVRGLAHPGRAGPAPGPLALAEVLGGLAVLTEQSLRNRDIALEIAIPETCRAVRAHATALQQVLLNLVVNARDAILDRREAEASRAPGRIGVAVSDDGAAPRLRIRVADTGGGIPPDVIDSVFDPFFTLKEAGRGNGLGLPVCRALLTELGGAIEVANGPEGAVFEITLPVAE